MTQSATPSTSNRNRQTQPEPAAAPPQQSSDSQHSTWRHPLASPHFRFPTRRVPDDIKRSGQADASLLPLQAPGQSSTNNDSGDDSRRMRIDQGHATPTATHLPRSAVEMFVGWSEVCATAEDEIAPPRFAQTKPAESPNIIHHEHKTLRIETGIGPNEIRPKGFATLPVPVTKQNGEYDRPRFVSSKDPFGKDIRKPHAEIHSHSTGTRDTRNLVDTPVQGSPEKRLGQDSRVRLQTAVAPTAKPAAKTEANPAFGPASKPDGKPVPTASRPQPAVHSVSPATRGTPVAVPVEKPLVKPVAEQTPSAQPVAIPPRPVQAPVTQASKAQVPASKQTPAAGEKFQLESIPLFPEPAWPYVSDLLLGAGWPFISRLAEGMEKILSGRSSRILVSGVQRGVGATTLALTLGRWAVAGGRKVLVVDADLQAAGLTRMLGRDPARSWPAVTRGKDFVTTGLVRSSRTGIAFATTGKVRNRQLWPPFVLDRLGELLESAGDLFDLVLIDAGPVNQVVAEMSACKKLTPCAMVVSTGSASEEPMIQSAHQRLGQLGAQRILSARNFSSTPLQRGA